MFFRKKRKYFLKLSGIALMAVVALIFAAVIFFLLLPHIMAVTMVFVVIVLIFIIIWMLAYIAMVLGASVYRYALPMQTEERKSERKR
jgi:fatty acid desaturase